MKISEVYIKNFRGYGENVNDSEGYYKFKDLDKYNFIIFNGYNGFGKTSFFDSIEWCLTGELSRIKLNEDILMKSNLKQSCYLKFHNSNKKDEERHVEVCVIFNNGIKIIRKTNCSSLYDSKYKDQFTIIDSNNNSLDSNDLNKMLFDNEKLEVRKLFEISFLGQENINRILRATSPSERTKEFMDLLGLSILNDVVEKSKNKSSLSKIINTFDTDLDRITKSKMLLEQQFQVNGWGSFDEYCKNVKRLKENLKDIKKDIEFIGEDYFDFLDNSLKDIEECTKFIDNSISAIEKFVQKKEDLIKDREILIEYFLLSRIVHYRNIVSDLIYISDNDVVKVIENKNKIEKKVSVYKESIDKLNSIESELISYKAKICEINIQSFIKRCEFDIIIDRFYIAIELIKNYKVFLKGYSLKRKFKNIKNLEKLRDINDKYINNINCFERKIFDEEKNISNLSNLNNSYKSVLNKVKKYLDNNENLECCPICLSEDFTHSYKKLKLKFNKDETINEQLTNIIDNTIQDGNNNVKELQKQLKLRKDNLKKLKEIYNKKVIEVVEKYISESEELDNIINDLMKNISDKLSCNKERIKHYSDMIDKSKEVVVIYEQTYKRVFNEDVDYNNIKVIDEQEINLKKKIYLNLMKNYKYKYKKFNITKDDFNTRITEINEKRKDLDNQNLKVVCDSIKEIVKIQELLKEIKNYKFTVESKKILASFLKESNNEEEIKSKREKFENYKNDISVINKRATSIQTDKFMELMKSNESIQWIYDKITPHPFFKKIEFKCNSGRGGAKMTNIVSEEDQNIYLDHIFSSAQLNVLALSIFLGLSLNQTSVKFEQLYLDDPIQSMDDINILSFIDLLRCLIDSEDFKSDIILSTHDSNFAKLLMIKMRNKSYRIINFDSYGIEGPIIS